MTPAMNSHLEMLMSQLSCVFQFVNERKIHRSKWANFRPTWIDQDVQLDYSYVELNAGRSVAVVSVDTEQRKYQFTQHYNYGVLLNIEVRTTIEDVKNPRHPIADVINHADLSEETIRNAMIDFEYALSLVTADVAKQVNNLGL